MPALTSAPDRPSPANLVVDPVDQVGLGALVAQTIDDARALVTAEIELQKARLGERVAAYRGAIILFAAAGTLALCGFIALLVGLILSLATLIGPGLATAAVVLAVLAIAAVLAVLGKSRLAPPDLTPRA